METLAAALCLVVVLEGLVLFAAPGAWKRAIEQLQGLEERQLRRIGALMLIVGLLALGFVRG